MAHSESSEPGPGAAKPDAGGAGPSDAAGRLRIRRAVPEDAREMARVGIRAWRTAYAALMPEAFLAGLSVEARTIAWRANLEQQEADRSPAWVAELGSLLVGYASSG